VKQQFTVAFFQHVTHELFKELIKLEFNDTPLPPLTHEEKNAVHYVAGYVCKKIYGHLKELSCPGQAEMMLCLSDMNGGDIGDEEHTDEWLRKINRGGLWKVSDEVYRLF